MPTVLLTRPLGRAQPLKSRLEECGWTVWLQPAIDIEPPECWDEVDAALRRLENGGEAGFDWILFSSPGGVEFFLDRAGPESSGLLRNVRLAAVGPGTAETLRKKTGRTADLVPEKYVAESLLDALAGEARRGGRFLSIRADRGRTVLRRGLEEFGASVTEIAAYRSRDRSKPDREIEDRLVRGEIDWTVVSSSAIASTLTRFFGENLARTRLLSIGPVTTRTLTEQGYPPREEAASSTPEAIVASLETWRRRRG